MRREKTEIVQGVYDAFRHRDVDTAFTFIDPTFELQTPAIYPEARQSYRGRGGIVEWMAMIDDVWGEWRFEPEQMIDAGEDKVLVLVRIIAEGVASQARLERDVAHLWTFSGGRAIGVQVFLDRAEGLKAAGVGG